MFGQKKRLVQKKFCQKKSFGQKKFLVKKNFWSKKIFVKKIFGQKNFCQINFLVKKKISREKKSLVKQNSQKGVGLKLYGIVVSCLKINFCSNKIVRVNPGEGFVTPPPSN